MNEGLKRLQENVQKLINTGGTDLIIEEILSFCPESLEDLNIMIEDDLPEEARE